MQSSAAQIPPVERVAAVAFCTDKYMEAPLHVAASSLLRNLHPDYTARFYLHLTDFTADDIESLRETLDRTARGYSIELLHADASAFRKFRPFYGNFTTYHRLLLPEIIQEDRLLYVDSDTLVEVDVAPLFELDMGKQPAGFVTIGVTSKNTATPLFTALGIPPDTPYFNAGVMLLNLPEWRRQNCTERVLDFCHEHNAQLIGDETALNGVFAGDYLRLDSRYNTILTRKTELNSIPKAGIFHFLENPKPWDIGGRLLLPHARMWFAGLRATAVPAYKRIFFLNPRLWLRALRCRGSYYRTFKWKLQKHLGRAAA